MVDDKVMDYTQTQASESQDTISWDVDALGFHVVSRFPSHVVDSDAEVIKFMQRDEEHSKHNGEEVRDIERESSILHSRVSATRFRSLDSARSGMYIGVAMYFLVVFAYRCKATLTIRILLITINSL